MNEDLSSLPDEVRALIEEPEVLSQEIRDKLSQTIAELRDDAVSARKESGIEETWQRITRSLPPSGCSALMASNAALPPPRLSDAMPETAIDGSLTVVSTKTSLIPACAAAASGVCIAVTSVGAIMMASGLDAATESRIGFCRVGSNFCGPWVLIDTPNFAASAFAPHSIEM